MKTLQKPVLPALRYHRHAYQFLLVALQYTQEKLGRVPGKVSDEASAHITGQELCEGIRELAIEQFGLLATTVFRHWGIRSTADFGRMVFELIERGEMRKTERDRITDFFNVYDFSEAFDRDYQFDVSLASVR